MFGNFISGLSRMAIGAFFGFLCLAIGTAIVFSVPIQQGEDPLARTLWWFLIGAPVAVILGSIFGLRCCDRWRFKSETNPRERAGR